MAAIHFVVHLQGTGDLAAAQQAVTEAIQGRMATIMAQLGSSPGQAPQNAEALTAALADALRQATRQKIFVPPTPPPETELREGASRGQCAVCLETLGAGQSCCRPPCLHAFHGACLREWLNRSPTCPVCKLSLAKEPEDARGCPTGALRAPRKLRYRFADVAGFTARELRYVAGYLGIIVEQWAERPELELAILRSPLVRVLSCEEELRSFSIPRLHALLQTSGADDTYRRSLDKTELVCALFASGQFLKDSEPSPTLSPSQSSTDSVPFEPLPQAEDMPEDESPTPPASSSGPVRRSLARPSRRAGPY